MQGAGCPPLRAAWPNAGTCWAVTYTPTPRGQRHHVCQAAGGNVGDQTTQASVTGRTEVRVSPPFFRPPNHPCLACCLLPACIGPASRPKPRSPGALPGQAAVCWARHYAASIPSSPSHCGVCVRVWWGGEACGHGLGGVVQLVGCAATPASGTGCPGIARPDTGDGVFRPPSASASVAYKGYWVGLAALARAPTHAGYLRVSRACL